jgi:hypothetical protein
MRRVQILVAVLIAALTWGSAVYADKGQTEGTAQPAQPAQTTESAKPIQLALVPPVQLVPEDESIRGFRLNIYGRNQNVSGVDIGLVHETKANFTGVEFGVLCFIHGEGHGLLFNGIYTEATERMTGLQVGMLNRSKSMHGLQIGLVNISDEMTGIQIGLWNEIKNKQELPVLPLFNACF